MTDCENVQMREALPELVHGTLSEAERVQVEAHVRGCDPCTEELVILYAVVRTAPRVAVDVARIAAAVPPYRRQRTFRVGNLRLAAAALLGAAGVSGAVLLHARDQQRAAPTVTSAPQMAAGVALVGTADLSDGQLEQLIADMGAVRALPPAEPEPITAPVADGGV